MKKKTLKVKTQNPQSKNTKKTQTTVVVSGGFDPIHIGHVRMFKKAKALGDFLIVVINNDNWLRQKKGFIFMPQNERKEIIESIGWVDKAVFTSHPKNPKDMSVSQDLQKIKPDIFAQGGDRKPGNIPSSEDIVCKEMGCKIIYNIGEGGKVQSSSLLATNFITDIINKPCPCKSGIPFTDCGLKHTPTHKKNLKKLLNT